LCLYEKRLLKALKLPWTKAIFAGLHQQKYYHMLPAIPKTIPETNVKASNVEETRLQSGPEGKVSKNCSKLDQ